QPQSLRRIEVTAGSVVSGSQRAGRIVASREVRRHERAARPVVEQAAPLPGLWITGEKTAAVVGVIRAKLSAQRQGGRWIHENADVGQHGVDLPIGGVLTERG